MATIYYDNDADLSLIRGKKVAIIGYGSQGHAHALNLRDSGVERARRPGCREPVAREGEGGRARRSTTVADVHQWADVIMMLSRTPRRRRSIGTQIEPNLAPGKMLMFAHGFNIRFGTITPRAGHRRRRWSRRRPPGTACARLSWKAPARRRSSPSIRTRPARRSALALSYAKGIGVTRAGVIETTFAEETETDLFGEQAVLCGGVSALIKAGFETLVEAGYQPEIAYFECLHELKLIVDLMYQGGLSYMRYSVSDTAEHGDYTGGPRIVTEETRKAMKKILEDIHGRRLRSRLDRRERQPVVPGSTSSAVQERTK